MRRLKIHIILILVSLLLISGVVSIAADVIDSGKEVPELTDKQGEFFAGTLTKLCTNVLIATGKWYIRVEKSAKHVFHPATTTVYTIETESDQEKVELWVTSTDGLPLAIGNQLNDRHYRKRLAIPMKANETYYIFVGSLSERLPISYRLAISPGSTHALSSNPIWERLSVTAPRNWTIPFGTGHEVFEGNHALYLQLDNFNPERPWVRVHVSSKSFDPLVCLLDENDHVIELNDDIASGNNDAEVVARWKSNILSIVVWPYEGVWYKARPDAAKVNVQVDAYRYNPKESLSITMTRTLRDPITGLIIGFVVSGLLSWLFFKISISRRVIEYALHDSQLLIDQGDFPEGEVAIALFGETVTNVGMCNIDVRYRGLVDLQVNDVQIPLRVQLGNVKRILKAIIAGKGEWGSPNTLVDPPGIELPIKFLQPRDSARLTIFFEQEKAVEPTCDVIGRILNGKIKQASVTISHAYSKFFKLATIGYIFLFFPIMLADYLFKIAEHWTWWYVLFHWVSVGYLIVFLIAIFANDELGIGIRKIKFLFKSLLSLLRRIRS